MMRPKPRLLNLRRSLSLLILGLALGLWLPTASQAALLRYTLTTTLGAGSTLNGQLVGGQLFTVFANIDSGSAITVSNPSPTYATATSRAPLSSPLWFQVGNSQVGILTGYNNLSSDYERDYDPDYGYSAGKVYFTANDTGGIGLDGDGNDYLDLTQTTVPVQVSAPFVRYGDNPYATSLGDLVFAGASLPATVTRAAVPEPGQVALGALAAGYALISAGRRYRTRQSRAV